RKIIPYYDLRHMVRPGITGWAQVRFRYGASAEDAHMKLQYDLYYVKRLSFALDTRILVQTVRVMLVGEGAQ
ncbi:MAG: sugar transferase, partial [Nitrospira sp.]|nr:sugar transferase [Nitrospira sp.]